MAFVLLVLQRVKSTQTVTSDILGKDKNAEHLIRLQMEDACPFGFVEMRHHRHISTGSLHRESMRLQSASTHIMWPFQRSPIIALVVFLVLTTSSTITSFPQEIPPSLPLPSRLVYQFPDGTWVENIAVRSNGDLLVTFVSPGPDLYLINPKFPSSPVLVYSFPALQSLLGIAELEHDVFYLAAGNTTNITTPTLSIWEIDMRSFSLSSKALVRKVTNIPEAVVLNGIIALSKTQHSILIADSGLGVVWRLNVTTGAYSVALSDPTMEPVATADILIGINGIKIRDGSLYFTSTSQGLVCRVPISKSGTATGPVEVLATGVVGADDFDLDGEGRPWIARNSPNVVSVLLGNGTLVDVVGSEDQLTVAGATSCAFFDSNPDRGYHGDHLLHCTTAGGLAAPVNGTVTEGGKVVAIDTKGF